MIAFIDDYRETYGVEPICKVLPIAPSTDHDRAAKRRDPTKLSARAQRDMALKPEITRVFAENFEVYGARKVWRQLVREGFGVARCTVARLMANLGLQGVIRGKPVRMTVPDKAAPRPLDHVNRVFHAPAPNRLWLSDFTSVSTCSGFVYGAFIIEPTRAASSAGGSAGPPMPASFWMLCSRRCTHAAPLIRPASCIMRIAARNTSASATPSGWSGRASSHLSAASVTATTTLSLRRSTVSTRPR